MAVSASSRPETMSAMAASPSRISMAMAPCAAAGSQSGATSRSRMRASKPRRCKPAAARMMASKSPLSSLASRVFTLPRRSSSSRSGRRARSCAWRRSDEVPTRAPCGSSSKRATWLETKASKGSARSRMAPMAKPDSSSIGTSFSECTAMSAWPACMATSSSLRNRPLPPICASGRSSTWSPRVLSGTRSMRSAGCRRRSRAATCSLCQRASALWRVAMRRRSSIGSVAADALAQAGQAATADLQFGVDAAQDGARLAVGVAAQLHQLVGGNQTVAVDAQEHVAELLFQRLQRFLDQVLAARVVDDGVLLLGLQVVDLFQRDQPQVAAHARAQVAAPLVLALDLATQLHHVVAAQLRGALQRLLQSLLADRLDQVVDGARLEGGKGVFVVGGAEDHRRRGVQRGQVASRFKTVDHRHGDVEEHGVGAGFVGQFDRFAAVAGLADDLDASGVAQQVTQALAGQRLVVGDQHFHGHLFSVPLVVWACPPGAAVRS